MHILFLVLRKSIKKNRQNVGNKIFKKDFVPKSLFKTFPKNKKKIFVCVFNLWI